MTISDKPATCITPYERIRFGYLCSRDREIPIDHPELAHCVVAQAERFAAADDVLAWAVSNKGEKA